MPHTAARKHRTGIERVRQRVFNQWLCALLLSLCIADVAQSQDTSPQPATPQSEQPKSVLRLANLPAAAATTESDSTAGQTLGGPGNQTLPAPGFQQGFYGEILELVDFRDQKLDEAIRVFAEQSGLNVVASAEAKDTIVNLYLRNVRPMDVLESLTKTHDLFYRIDQQSGIIRIYTTDEYDRNLASFREEQTEVFTLLYPNPIDVAVAIRDLFGDRVQLNFGVGDEDAALDLAYRLNRFDLIDSRSLGLGSFQGQYSLAASRGFNGITGLGGFDPYYRQFPTALPGSAEFQRLHDLTADQIQQLVNALESKETQVAPTDPNDQEAIEQLLKERQATIYVTVVRRNNQVIVRTGDSETMGQVTNLIHRLDVPTPLVLLEVKVMSVSLDDDFRSVFDYQFSDGVTIAGGYTTGDILPPPSDLFAGEIQRYASMLPGGSEINQGDLTFQIVSEHFRARMQLLEDDNRVTVLNTPLLLTANNEVSRIFIGDTIPFTIGFNSPQVIAGAGGANTNIAGTPITELRDVGQSLLITPSINADRTVTLRIVQENARRVVNGGTIPVLQIDGTIEDAEVDTVNRSTISGTVVAKDGLAVALGGLIEEEVSDQREQVPFIGKLPVLGFFFRRQESSRSRRELIVMIRPYIFNTPSESAALSQELLQHLSVHPNALTGEPTMHTFSPDEVVRTDIDQCELHREFRFHNVVPKRY